MKFAYADPPYIGQAEKFYSDDPNCAEVDHKELIEQLCQNYDAWALSLSSSTLKFVLSLCPDNVRIGAWVKPFCAFKKGVNPAYAWEPVIFWGGRKRAIDEWFARDFISAMPPVFQGKHESDIAGQKPEAFCFWLFELLGALPGDEFDDLFPGSGAVTRAWGKYSRQLFNQNDVVDSQLKLFHQVDSTAGEGL